MLVYVLKSAACLAILLAFYKLFLEKEHMHTLKRFYLLGALVAALVIPFVTFVEYVEIPVPTEVATHQQYDEVPTMVGSQQEIRIDYLPIILWSLYILGALLYGFKFARNLVVIILKIRKNPKYRVNSIYNVLLSESVAPHTFLSYIFLNKQKFEAQQIPKVVLLHEETHARQKHSWDVLFIEFLQVVFWFNPLIYLVKKAIKLNHEFLADRAVLNKGIQPASYQNILLEFSSNSLQPTLANAINYSSIKKRFTVMKTRTSKKSILIRSLFLLPILTLLIYGFSETRVEQVEVNKATPNQEFLQETLEIGESKKKADFENQGNSEITPSNIRLKPNNINLKKEKLTTFIVSVQKNKDSIRLKCNSGCRWADIVLDYTKTSKYIINDYGFSEGKTLETDKFAFSIKPSESGVSLTGLKGTAWLDLNFSLIKNQTQFINENGMLAIKSAKLNKNKIQDGATRAQIKEYNTLAKKYNTMSKYNFKVIGKEVKQLEHIYGHMTGQQRKNAESFPDFPKPPPPPSPVVKKSVNGNIPPPLPPIKPPTDRKKYSDKLLDAFDKLMEKGNLYGEAGIAYNKYGEGNINDLRQKYGEAMKLYDSYVKLAVKEKLMAPPHSKTQKNRKGEIKEVPSPTSPVIQTRNVNEVPPPPPPPSVATPDQKNHSNIQSVSSPSEHTYSIKSNPEFGVPDPSKPGIVMRHSINSIPPPPPPKSPEEHLIEMAEKNAIFYFEGKEITSDKALEVLKKSKKISVLTRHEGLERPIVEMSSSPIAIDPQ